VAQVFGWFFVAFPSGKIAFVRGMTHFARVHAQRLGLLDPETGRDVDLYPTAAAGSRTDVDVTLSAPHYDAHADALSFTAEIGEAPAQSLVVTCHPMAATVTECTERRAQ
jgi:hypothetical protein